MEQLKYPIGPFVRLSNLSKEQINIHITEIEALPFQIRKAVTGLSDEQLDTRYRPDGWTIRQVVHHLADSHINSYIRFRWTLTEDKPTIKAYFEDRWAELDDAKTAPVEISLKILDAIHPRWVMLLKSLTDDEMKRSFIHPETGLEVPIDINIANYAWHGKHHVAHIEKCKERMGW